MLSHVLDRISFWALFLVIVLLPLFVLPFTNIPIEISKGLLMVVGLSVSIIFWTLARFFDGEIVLPRSSLLLSGFAMSLVFFLSAIFSTTPKVAMFGTMLDVGSFWFMFATFLLMLFSALVVMRDSGNAKKIFLGIIISSSAVLLFQVIHLFFPGALSLGLLPQKMDNVFGSWNSFGILAGFSSIISLFLLEFFSMSGGVKWFLGGLVLFATAVVALVNFPFVWGLLGVSALIIFVYKISFYSKLGAQASKADFPIFSLIVMMASLLFFMSGQFIGGYIPNKLGLVNIDISPTFKATTLVTKSVLAKDPVLGMGPNRFADAWALYKPASINTSSFWDTAFNSGSGLLPTFASTTGGLGLLSLLVFFGLFLTVGLKSLFATLQHGTNQEITAFFVASLYLFVSSLFYVPGSAVILLAFAFAGIFVGLYSTVHRNGKISLMFLQDPRKGFISIFLLVFVMIAAAALTFRYLEKFASVTHFRSALSSPTIPEAEASIAKALTLHQNDLYLRTYALINILKLNSLVSESKSATDEVKAELQQRFDNAVNGALVAISYNKENYSNYKMLGLVYETVAPLSNAEMYQNAVEAYTAASNLNPGNPGLKLDMARVSLLQKKYKEAKEYSDQALALKADYIDGYLMLSQVNVAEGNRTLAISNAEKALALVSANTDSQTYKDLQSYVNALRNGNTPTAPTVEEEKSDE